MRHRALALLLTFASTVQACSPPEPQVEGAAQRSAPADAREPSSFERQVAEYVRKYPYQLTYDYTVRYTGGDPAMLNTWVPGGEPRLVKAGEDILPRTNNDTYYKGAALFLENGPVVLESNASTQDRFNSFQLIDDRNVNFRNIVYPKGRYTLYFGERPEQIEGEAVEVPSKLSVVIVRVEVRDRNDGADVAAAKVVLDGMKIGGARADEFPRLDLLSGYPAEVAAEANRRMTEVFTTVPFTQTIVGPGQEPGREVPYLYHSAGTKGGWGGADPSHSAFEAIFFDENGDEMKGGNGTYTVTTEEPPVGAFWSITVYDTERGGFLHPNDDDRYHINDTVAVRNDDGTVTFTFKQACRTFDVNCLEVPAGRFDVSTRYYLPHEEIITGAWTFPKIALAAQ
jgi:hypothetical protein